MKRTLLTLLTLTAIVHSMTAQTDSTSIHPYLTDYLKSIMTEPIDTIICRVDSLIAAVEKQGPDVQSQVAGVAYDFFCDSPLMGQEAVSVHIADNYFLNKKLKWIDEKTFPGVYSFAEFNRHSLLGKSAPELRMEGIDSLWVSMRNVESPYKVLYFYEPQCSSCRRQTPALASLAKDYKGPLLTVFTVCTQADRKQWEAYVEANFSGIDNPDVTFIHLWDPESASNYQMMYGVLSTPTIYLLDNQNIIIGRRLDVQSLGTILAMDNAGHKQYERLFDKIFESLRPLSVNDAIQVADAFASRSVNDTALFRESMYNLFQYLRLSEEFELQRGALYIAEAYIAARPEYWSSEFFDKTVHQLALSRLNPLGSPATDLVLQTQRGRNANLLDCKGSYHLIVFHLVNCEQCRTVIDQLQKIKDDFGYRDISVTLVYTGDDQKAWKDFVRKMPYGWRYLMDAKKTSGMMQFYDLEYVPHIYLLDPYDTVIAKDISVDNLARILPYL